jgi:uncharacterized membrane protein
MATTMMAKTDVTEMTMRTVVEAELGDWMHQMIARGNRMASVTMMSLSHFIVTPDP